MFYSFLSQAFGLLADCDVGSDAFRWAGRNRVYIAYAACVNSTFFFQKSRLIIGCDLQLRDGC